MRAKKDALLLVTTGLGMTSLFICTRLHGVGYPFVFFLRLPATNAEGFVSSWVRLPK